ncbi:transposable element Tcb2 transposase [Trichonephila clavipes]|uniref:Transposable element Tcb2 transposase n=1 Tax=Trichonephila clavipes TaxID=2585209 RepID=A0A8X6VIL7_TRICX|nr:transposable element Tcb2 transposase [Trichonephila clavipes]
METGWSARQVGRSDLTVRSCWDLRTEETLFTRRPGLGRSRQTSRRENRHITLHGCVALLRASVSSRTIARNQVVFSDESRFNFSSDDSRVHEWRRRGELINPAFILQRHTAPTAGVMVWGVIAYYTWSLITLIHGAMTAQRYVHDIFQPHVLPLMAGLPGAIFQQDIARPHTARMSQNSLRPINTLPWLSRSPDLTPIEHIWDHLTWKVEQPTSLVELQVRYSD